MAIVTIITKDKTRIDMVRNDGQLLARVGVGDVRHPSSKAMTSDELRELADKMDERSET